jgi:hypothetical protein
LERSNEISSFSSLIPDEGMIIDFQKFLSLKIELRQQLYNTQNCLIPRLTKFKFFNQLLHLCHPQP